MLINLGLGSMIGTMTGITTPVLDAYKVQKELFTGEWQEREPKQPILNIKYFPIEYQKCFFLCLCSSVLLRCGLPVWPVVRSALRELLCDHVR